jgi:shikimate dehydrogenase
MAYNAGVQLDGSTKLVGVFGWPVAHTASPAIHNAAFESLRMNWAYLALPVEPQNLRGALFGARDMGFVGVNLTVPHKVSALEFMDDMDAEARKLGAVNTVVMEAGKLRGFNTDGYGFARAIKEEFNLSLKGRRVLVLGAGGAGRAIAVKCALEGAKKIWIANRTPGKVAGITQVAVAPIEELPLTPAGIAKVVSDADLLVNATSVGLKAGESLGLDKALFSERLYVYDTVYRPAETELMRVAGLAGAKVAGGASMLLHQGAKSFELWTKRKAPLAVMRRALRSVLGGGPA